MDKQKIVENIKSALDKARPFLQSHGGDVEFVDFDEATGTVKVRLQGQCVGCPMAGVTLKDGIEEDLKNEIEEVKAVEAV